MYLYFVIIHNGTPLLTILSSSVLWNWDSPFSSHSYSPSTLTSSSTSTHPVLPQFARETSTLSRTYQGRRLSLHRAGQIPWTSSGCRWHRLVSLVLLTFTPSFGLTPLERLLNQTRFLEIPWALTVFTETLPFRPPQRESTRTYIFQNVEDKIVQQKRGNTLILKEPRSWHRRRDRVPDRITDYPPTTWVIYV